MITNALIIFIRNPVLGKVKTRIAAKTNDATALKIYMQLLQHTHDITSSVDADVCIFYSEYIETNDIWHSHQYKKYLQQGNTLGDKMQHAFTTVFALGYSHTSIIGSDCYELTTSIIDTAFTELKDSDAVIGPAKDGGYYLLGLCKMMPLLFKNKEWSSNSVYTDTIADLDNTGKSYKVLPVLNDVDELEDVPPQLL
jgi:uncharacterized protein